jgi:hypothetical protein
LVEAETDADIRDGRLVQKPFAITTVGISGDRHRDGSYGRDRHGPAEPETGQID